MPISIILRVIPIKFETLKPPSVKLAGKLASRGYLNSITPGHMVHVLDQVSKRRFLVDTGARHFSALVIIAAHCSAASWPLRNSNSLLG